ncbi:S-adenosyl-l-methionine hydroxide adenosyltransferase family protein [Desulfobaculum sp. SPO524]|uniref:SAM hydrolase/SAM-dependent halogenase family protein n=1 Tax=Desulfobaculum sp. SPO524 TaxID=3378071 RepID=UPI003853ED0A
MTARTPAPIALLTDFGLGDPYVAQMKGRILSLVPDARIVDISHGVEPFNLAQGGFFLNASRRHFPEGTVFAAVVDPGVGTTRGIVLLEKDGQSIIAPDNGLASLVLGSGGPVRVFDLSVHMHSPRTVSATFHGRDVFAPLAAQLAQGAEAESLGPEMAPEDLVTLDWARPRLEDDNAAVTATVLHVDRFGNCILNLPAREWLDRLCHWEGLALSAKGRTGAVTCCRTYADLPLGSMGLLEGSQGYLELSMNQASAARLLAATCGTTITLAAAQRL